MDIAFSFTKCNTVDSIYCASDQVIPGICMVYGINLIMVMVIYLCFKTYGSMLYIKTSFVDSSHLGLSNFNIYLGIRELFIGAY